MANTPILLTLYDENNEAIEEYQRTVVPWGMLKRALKFQSFGDGDMTGEAFDELAGFVCELFGGKFTVQQLNDGADIAEVFAVINAVITRAQAFFPNSPAARR